MFRNRPKCQVCNKTVGFAEKIMRDGNLFHKSCFKCATCNKKLSQSGAMKDGGKFYCKNCHSKQFGPMGFRKGVNRNVQMKRVRMSVQPSFAYTAPSPQEIEKYKPPPRKQRAKPIAPYKKRAKKKDLSVLQPSNTQPTAAPVKPKPAPKPRKKPAPVEVMQEFDVAVFNGTDLPSLKTFLKEGGANCSNWPEQRFNDLLDHIKNGKCELGLDPEGNALRVANIAKVFIYDQYNDVLLYNPLNSYEQDDFADERKDEQEKEMMLFQGAIGYDNANVVEVEEDPSDKIRPVEIPPNFIFQTTFSPFNETPKQAAARVLAWKFSLENVAAHVFSDTIPLKAKEYESVHYPGLKSQYQVHHCILRSEYVAPLQKIMERNHLTPLVLNETTNTGINTNWYAWLKRNAETGEILDEIRKLYESNVKIEKLVGNVDFNGVLAKNMANLLVEEGSLKELDQDL